MYRIDTTELDSSCDIDVLMGMADSDVREVFPLQVLDRTCCIEQLVPVECPLLVDVFQDVIAAQLEVPVHNTGL